MNNPPDVSPDPSEHEEYAHNVQKHVKAYLMVGATLLAFTAITVALSYVNFGTQKANIAVALLGWSPPSSCIWRRKNGSSTAFSFSPVFLCSDFFGLRFLPGTIRSSVRCH